MAILDQLRSLERDGWDALCEGTGADFYGTIMTGDAVMVLAHGQVLDRAAVVESLAEAPRWHRYSLTDDRVVPVGDDAAALVYTCRATRDDGTGDFVALMTSVYVRTMSGWRLALYQQTPVPQARS